MIFSLLFDARRLETRRSEAHPITDVETAIRDLDEPGWRRLRTAARDSYRRYRLADPAYDAEDLLQEAFVRLLSGNRSWRRGIGFEYQVARTMDSVASDWRRRAASAPEIHRVGLEALDESGDGGVANQLFELAAAERSIEDRLADAGILRQIAEHFAEDPDPGW